MESFLPESEFGAGLTNYEYAHLAEVMGTCHIASEAMNVQLQIQETWKL